MAHILLVEDEAWLGELYHQLLIHAGHTVQWCQDGYEAIELIDQERPDVIVLDLFLPWGNGLLLVHELASHSDLERIPVIVCSSALPRDLDLVIQRHYGIVEALDKAQLSPQKFVSVVNRVLTHADFSH